MAAQNNASDGAIDRQSDTGSTQPAYTIIDHTYDVVVVGAGGAILSSADGLSWTSVASGTTASLAAVTFASQFVAVGASGTVLTSLDGTTWLKPASNTPALGAGVDLAGLVPLDFVGAAQPSGVPTAGAFYLGN